jgi:hypothetical protein
MNAKTETQKLIAEIREFAEGAEAHPGGTTFEGPMLRGEVLLLRAAATLMEAGLGECRRSSPAARLRLVMDNEGLTARCDHPDDHHVRFGALPTKA